MKVRLSVECDDSGADDQPSPFADFGLVEKVFEEELQTLWPTELNKPNETEISLTFLDADDMREQNKSFRDVDAPTDVLTFPLWENQNGEFCPEQICGEVLPLGDILVCTQIVAANAKEHNVTFSDELCLILAHGLLHLLSWDHDTEEKQSVMWQRQNIIKEKLLREVR